MTDDELVTLLRRAMRAHDRGAPTLDAIRERLDAPQPVRPGRRRWLPAVAAVLGVLAVVAAGITWSVSRDESGPAQTDRSEPNRPAEPVTRTVTVFYADRVDEGPVQVADWRLVPRQVTVESPGFGPLDAVRALFERPAPNGLTNWFHLGSEPVAEATSVEESNGQITVGIDRPLRDPYPNVGCVCPDAEIVMQQLAWTVSTALESQAPVVLTVNGHQAEVVNGERVYAAPPAGYVVAQGHRAFSWYRNACGPLQIEAVIGEFGAAPSTGRHVDIPVDESSRSVDSLNLRVGETLGVEIIGGCFRQLNASADSSTVLERTLPGVDLFVAQGEGRATITVGGCVTTFTYPDCVAPYVEPASFAVHVTND
jgi:hypothetical protein